MSISNGVSAFVEWLIRLWTLPRQGRSDITLSDNAEHQVEHVDPAQKGALAGGTKFDNIPRFEDQPDRPDVIWSTVVPAINDGEPIPYPCDDVDPIPVSKDKTEPASAPTTDRTDADDPIDETTDLISQAEDPGAEGQLEHPVHNSENPDKFDTNQIGVAALLPPAFVEVVSNFTLVLGTDNESDNDSSCWSDGTFTDGGVLNKSYETAKDLLVVGDIHGDIVALDAIIEVWRTKHPTSILVFLGDFVDRGFYDHLVISRLKNLIGERASEILVIAGNHDVALTYDSNSNKFRSSVEPSEYKDQLNQWLDEGSSDSETYVADAKWFIEFMRKRPVAAFVGGVLLTHGGFPRLEGEYIDVTNNRLSDYTWNRLAEYPTRLMDYTSRTSEFGSVDFEQFRKQCGDQGIPVSIVLRGHDHIIAPNRGSRGIRYSCPGPIRRGNFMRRIYTINSMCYLHDGELSPFSSISEVSPAIVSVKWLGDDVGDRKPHVEVIELIISDDLIDTCYYRCRDCHRTFKLGHECAHISSTQQDNEQPAK